MEWRNVGVIKYWRGGRKRRYKCGYGKEIRGKGRRTSFWTPVKEERLQVLKMAR